MSCRKKNGKNISIQVTFTGEQWKLIELFKGIMGTEAAEIVRNIALAWLAKKSIITDITKKNTMQGSS